MFSRHFWLSREVLIGFSAVILIVVPVFALAGNKVIYVDHKASGTEDGSSEHPYETISDALKHAKSGTEVHIRSGEYKENITIPKNVKVTGNSKDRGKVVIKADHTDQATVTMKHDSELMHLVVENGRYGVKVEEDAQAHLYNVSVKGSRKDCVNMESAPKDKTRQALFDHVYIHDCGRAGIYSDKRFVIIVDSQVKNNASDGIDFAADMKAWIEHTDISSNGGSGMKLIVDETNVWTKSNTIRGNSREGIELNSYGVAGSVGVKKTNIIQNGRYGIARVARTTPGFNGFGGLVIGTDVNVNRIEGNVFGSISSIIRGF